MKRFYHFLLSSLLLGVATVVSAQSLSVSVGDASGAVGSQVCVDLTGRNFNDISAFSFSLNFDPAVLRYEDEATSGTLLNTAINFNLNNNTPNAVRTLWSLFFASEGIIDAGPFPMGNVCFTVLQEQATDITITGSPVPISFTTPSSQEVTDFVVSGGTVNGSTSMPSCNDDIQNGDETGVDCGGSNCPPCNTGGNDGGSSDCGMGTTDFVLCVAEACAVAVNATTCLELTAGNLTNITAFQTDVVTDANQLAFQSFMDAGALSHPINVNTSTGTPRLLFFQPDQSGNTLTNGTVLGTLCFTNRSNAASSISLTNITARNNDGNAVSASGNPGAVNNCATMPTCTDGIRNGNETGVDCGGPDCAPCPPAPSCTDGIRNGSETGVDCGGPDCAPCDNMGSSDCGAGTTNLTFCLSDVCDIPVNGSACLELTAGNLTAVTAFQMDVNSNAAQLTFQSFTDAGALSHPINANTSTGTPRLLFFQPDQSGNTITDGTVLGTLCFTNRNADMSTVTLTNLTARDNNGNARAVSGSMGTVNGCAAMPNCNDGIRNGNETGVDCGGPDCAPCAPTPTCSDGIRNGNETGVDCGGPDCAPCSTVCGGNGDNPEICVGNVCADAGAEVCLPVFIGNFDMLSGFQFELSFAERNLSYVRFEQSPDLGPVLSVANPDPGRISVAWNDVTLAGVTHPNDSPVLEICFQATNTEATPITFLNPENTLRVFDPIGQQLPATGNPGSINGTGCGTSGPTCTDGIMNGNETGVDCGGPDCPPCASDGGPDTNCGMGTTNVTLCLGDACNIPVNGTACVPLTAGNFTNITAFQTDLLANASELTFVSWTDAGALSHPIIANNSSGTPRLLFFQPDQSGNTIPGGTVLGEACFTNRNAGASLIELGSLTARDNNGSSLPISGSQGGVNTCAAAPTCEDGIMNGNETGVDCGGPDCPACPTNAPLDLTVASGTASVGETVCVDVSAANFTNITQFGLTLNYDPAVLQLGTLTATSTLAGFTASNFDTTTPGRVVVNYTAASPQTLMNGASLFTICWTVLTAAETNVTLGGASATNAMGMNLTVNATGGIINAGGAPSGNELTYLVSNGTGGVGQEVCLGVSTNNFTNIAGTQFAIIYDESRLQFNSGTSTNVLPGLQIANPDPGVIRVLWADFSATGNTLTNGTRLLDLCFTVLESCETEVTIMDIPNFRVQATDGNNQSVANIQTRSGTVNAGQSTNCDVMPPANLVLDLGTAEGGVGQEVCIDLNVQNFTDLTDLSFSINYDADVLTFQRATDFALTSISGANISVTSPGVLTFDWDAASAAGQSISNGVAMLRLCFTVDMLQSTNISFANTPTIIRAANTRGQNIGVVPSGGNINANVPVTERMTFDIGESSGNVGETICLPVTVFDPSPLTGFQFTIQYDNTRLEYVPGSNNLAFSGFLSVNSTTNPGFLRILWDEPQAMPLTATNGAPLFQLCFRVIADGPSVLNFADAPTQIEFSLGTNAVTVDLLPGQANGGEAPVITGADVRNPRCFGESNGSISLNVSGGNTLTYQWTPNVSSGPNATGLAAGNYSVVVTNTTTGQTTSEDYTLSTLPFEVTVADTDGVSCFGEADGAITITTTGGATPFLIDWNGNLQDGTLIQSNLRGGTYSVTVTDNNGCSISRTNINIGEPTELNISGTSFNIDEDSDGGVNTVVVGGRPSYRYAWSGPNGYSSTSKDIDDVTEPGTYCVTVTDNNGCTDEQCFAINAALAAGVVVDPGCVGENNGSIDLTPVGGDGNYTYAWRNSSGPLASPNTNRQDVSGLPPGDYTVAITSGDQNITLTIGIDAPTPIMVSGMVTPASNGSNGTITITPAGGNAPYTYRWQDNNTNQNRTELTPGEYCVTVRDNSGCTQEQCFTVAAAPVSFISTTTLPTSCPDSQDGTIRLVVENGVQPFTVNLEPTGTSETFNSNTIELAAPAGTYQIVITDAQGGRLTTELTVTSPPQINAMATRTSDTENSGCSGMIALNIAGGTPGYTVSWDNMDTGPSISQLCAGDYTATVTDANGCTFTTQAFSIGRIEENLVSITEVSCDGGNDGAIDVTITGGEAPYTYAWSAADSDTEIATTEDISGITNGEYTLTVSDATGATLIRNYTVTVVGGFAVTASATSDFGGFEISCSDATDGRAVAIVSGRGIYNYEWLQGDTVVDTDSILNDVGPGTYELLVTSDAGCEIMRMVTLTAPPAIVITPDITPITCNDDRDGAIAATPTGGVAPFAFAWSTGSQARRISGLGEDSYSLTVTDANGCTATATYELTAPEDLVVTFESTDADDGCNGSVTILPLGGSGTYNYFWPQLPGQGNNAVAEGLCPGDYTIEVTDGTGCQTVTLTATVQDRRFPCLSAREVITPNGDGLNEAFILFCSGDDVAINNRMEIYNRWGQLVFVTDDYNCSTDDGANCFEGRTNDGSLLPAGPYYYIFNFTNPIGEEMQQRGSLTIVRD